MRSSILFVLCLAITGSSAQMVQKCCFNSNSTFLWGFPTASHTQSLYLPGDLTNPVVGSINRMYWRYGSTGIATGNTLTGVTIRLGLTPQTAFTGGDVFFTALDTVLQLDTLVIPPGATGDWFGISLDTLFAYDAVQTLIVDVNWTTSITTAFGCLGSPNNGRKLHANNNIDLTGSTTSTTWQDIGFDVQLVANVPETSAATPSIYPVPAAERLSITLPAAVAAPARMSILDMHGRFVMNEPVRVTDGSLSIDLRLLADGLYMLQLDGMRPVRFVKG
jgi:Secretion system C-terminal sorting domain